MAALGVVLFVIGAIIAFGIQFVVEGFNLFAIGVILMIAGIVAFIAGLVIDRGWASGRVRSERHVSADGRHVVEESRTNTF